MLAGLIDRVLAERMENRAPVRQFSRYSFTAGTAAGALRPLRDPEAVTVCSRWPSARQASAGLTAVSGLAGVIGYGIARWAGSPVLDAVGFAEPSPAPGP
ncbi:hypothetical protein ABT131_21995 [Streptomyces sp900105245]|uniref:hypothetical protein n=1 Tax=Streptomyces sp. 900105245 TaxID=3154379 RepID=UPI00331AB219